LKIILAETEVAAKAAFRWIYREKWGTCVSNHITVEDEEEYLEHLGLDPDEVELSDEDYLDMLAEKCLDLGEITMNDDEQISIREVDSWETSPKTYAFADELE
jgi:hypothetical protein